MGKFLPSLLTLLFVCAMFCMFALDVRSAEIDHPSDVHGPPSPAFSCKIAPRGETCEGAFKRQLWIKQ